MDEYLEKVKAKQESKRFAAVEEILKTDPNIAHGVRCLILLRVPLKDCNTYIENESRKKIGPQSLKTLAIKWGGAKGVAQMLQGLQAVERSLPEEEKKDVFIAAREYAKKISPLTFWRTDPGVDYCIQELLAEECTKDFTITRKAKIVHDVLKDQDINVDPHSIRKVLESGGYAPESLLLEFYPDVYLANMRERAREVIALSKKSRVDNLSFEHDVWKDRPLCIQIAEALNQGASVNALSVLARNAGYTFEPVSFQKFMQRYKVNDRSITDRENRAAASSALRALHLMSDEEMKGERLGIRDFLTHYTEALVREQARTNDLINGTQSKRGFLVLRNQIDGDVSQRLSSEIVNLSVVRRNKRRTLVVTSYPEHIDALRKEYAEQLTSGTVLYSQWHELKDYDDLMYVLRGLASLKIMPLPGRYQALLQFAKADSIIFREMRPVLQRPAVLGEGEVSTDALFNSFKKFIPPSSAIMNESQYILRTRDRRLLRDTTLSEEPLRLGFRRVRDSDVAKDIQYAADLIDDANTTVATLICSRAEEGLYEWLKEHGVVSLEIIENARWAQPDRNQSGRPGEPDAMRGAAE